MNYPLLSEYIEAIKSAEDNFEKLSYLRLVLGVKRLLSIWRDISTNAYDEH